MAELDDEILEEITSLCKQGDAFIEQEEFPAALRKYWQAWDVLPEPQLDWEAATWILGAIGDANFINNDFVAGRDNLTMAMRCPGAIGNPFLHLRLGQCQFELGDLNRAADELARAFLPEGESIFQEEDSKYLAFLKTKLKPRLS
jgi:tetratricopeptide (TPR) repeat protein